MTGEVSDPLGSLSIGGFDVEPGGLIAGGVDWEQIEPVDVENEIGSDVAQALPLNGWRELELAGLPAPSHHRMFAAPHATGWAVAHLVEAEGRRILSADPGPHAPRPGRPARRAGLVLQLEDGARTDFDGLNALVATLTNDSTQTWFADGGDSGHVHAWLLNERGERLATSWLAYAPLTEILTDLGPQESVDLRLNFGPPASELPLGTYGIEMLLVALDLWARGEVEIR